MDGFNLFNYSFIYFYIYLFPDVFISIFIYKYTYLFLLFHVQHGNEGGGLSFIHSFIFNFLRFGPPHTAGSFGFSLKAVLHLSLSVNTFTHCVTADRIHLCHKPRGLQSKNSSTEKNMFARLKTHAPHMHSHTPAS